MRNPKTESGARPHAKARNLKFDRIPIRLTAFTFAGFVAGSALAYGLVNNRLIDDEPTAALSQEQLAESGIELAALPPSSLSDAVLFVTAPAVAAEAPAAETETTAEALSPPAPERFSLTQPALNETVGGLPVAVTPVVEIATTDEQVEEIEIRLAESGDPNFVLPEVSEPTDVDALETAALDESPDSVDQGDGRWSNMVQAEAVRYVNLRDAPDNDSRVIRVVPAGDALSVETDCPSWCAVIHEGTRGYIYQSFIADKES